MKKKPTKPSRAIFKFFDGTKQRAVDPMKVQFALLEVADFDANLKASFLESPEAQELARKCFSATVSAVRKAFDVKELADDESGLTDAECVVLLQEFGEFMGDLKKKAESSPTWSPPTEPSDEN